MHPFVLSEKNELGFGMIQYSFDIFGVLEDDNDGDSKGAERGNAVSDFAFGNKKGFEAI